MRSFAAVAIACLLTVDVATAVAGQRTFPSAEAAVQALIAAAKAEDRSELLAIFGPEGKGVIESGDPVADRAARDSFIERATARTHLEPVGDNFAALSVGEDDWPFPIPLVKDGKGWSFDTAAGKTELLNRRVGRNELNTINTCREYVTVQREYARLMQAESGVAEYARRVRSTPGKHDGLYWESAAGEQESPLGPLFASASREGYLKGGSDGPQPFHGYVYKILTAAGPDAPGGPKDYIKNGRMTEGFGLLAYPAGYGTSGVMTFQVNQQGIVFQKDLGPNTAAIAAKITAYDPDDSWDPVDE
jgi:hypothetical protein